MNFQWTDKNFDFDKLILAGDIGGTNSTFALVGTRDGDFKTILKCPFKTADIAEPENAIKQTLEFAANENKKFSPQFCCISAAGPVKNNKCTPTNISWAVDGEQIQEKFNIKTLIINDFQAISYSLPILDVNETDMITPLKKAKNGYDKSTHAVRAVVGAGTGLGVGYILTINGKHFACPSEGGHINFASIDDQTNKLKKYVTENLAMLNESESFISGKGITNIFKYFIDSKKIPIDDTLKKIQNAPDDEKPKLISDYAPDSQPCRQILRTFVKLYAAFASDISSVLLPDAGLYIAGGIVTKISQYFTEDDLFLKHFLNYKNPNIAKRMENIPIYIIKDYSVSLLGAANAALGHFTLS